MCLDAMKNEFIRGCRPFILMDGLYLNGPYGGRILLVMSLDGSNEIFPMAFALVEVENMDNWTIL